MDRGAGNLLPLRRDHGEGGQRLAALPGPARLREPFPLAAQPDRRRLDQYSVDQRRRDDYGGADLPARAAALVAVPPGRLRTGARVSGPDLGLVPDAARLGREGGDPPLRWDEAVPRLDPFLPRADPGRYRDRRPLVARRCAAGYRYLHVLPGLNEPALLLLVLVLLLLLVIVVESRSGRSRNRGRSRSRSRSGSRNRMKR